MDRHPRWYRYDTCPQCGGEKRRDALLCKTCAIGSSTEERFWRKVRRGDPNECWVWLGATRSGPLKYGKMTVEGAYMAAHRYSYELAYGPIPDGMLVCHKCDNPSCVNPAHLFLGTHRDNMQDCIEKNRFVFQHEGVCPEIRGAKNPNARLTDSDVRAIRDLYAAGGHTKTELSRMYHVGRTTITRVVDRFNWKHLP